MTWVIDPAHSQVEFTAKYMMLTNVRGRFGKFSGTFELDEEHPERSEVDLTIDTTSVDTNMPAREGHLKSPDFFDVENHPTITFRSTRVVPSGEDFKVYGNLTIKGTTREVALDVAYNGEAKDVMGNQRKGFTVRGSISRKDFGLNWNVALEAGGFLVGDQIKIEADVQLLTKAAVDAMAEARRKQAAAAA